eukprot:scaffold1916_cov294-Prasinococcus_capsulatus_cf.AAC.8
MQKVRLSWGRTGPMPELRSSTASPGVYRTGCERRARPSARGPRCCGTARRALCFLQFRSFQEGPNVRRSDRGLPAALLAWHAGLLQLRRLGYMYSTSITPPSVPLPPRAGR